MSGNGRIRVLVRPRPCVSQSEKLLFGQNYVEVATHRAQKRANGRRSPVRETSTFSFDRVVKPDISQEDLFQESIKSMIDSALEGINTTIFAYGQTGAGKTHTVTGELNTFENRGLVPRTLSYLFEKIGAEGDSSIQIKLSVLEIYNERFYDLLVPDDELDMETNTLVVQTDSSGQIFVKGLTKKTLSTEEEALGFIFEAQANRAIASHQLNEASTRSHCVFTVHIENRKDVEDANVGSKFERITCSKLNLVDLAGSERVLQTNTTGMVLEEAKSINKSLSFLEHVVVALGDKSREHVPYRQSKLTHVLQDALGGNCKTLMLACIWPIDAHFGQTLATLKFSSRMMRITNTPKVNSRSNINSGILKDYENEIALLRSELAFQDQFLGKVQLGYAPYCESQSQAIKRSVEKYIENGDHYMLQIQSMRHVKEIMKTLRTKIIELENRPETNESASASETSTGNKVNVTPNDINKSDETNQISLENASTSAYNGQKLTPDNLNAPTADAPSQSRHQPMDRPNNSYPDRSNVAIDQVNLKANNLNGSSIEPETESSSQIESDTRDSISREEGFESFKTVSPGKELFQKLLDAKAKVFQSKKKRKLLKASINQVKKELDELLLFQINAEQRPADEHEAKAQQPTRFSGSGFDEAAKNVTDKKEDGSRISRQIGPGRSTLLTTAEDHNQSLNNKTQEDTKPKGNEDPKIPTPTLDEEAIVGQIKKKKKAYKSAFIVLKNAKTEEMYLQELVSRLRLNLTSAFNAWWEDRTNAIAAQVEPPQTREELRGERQENSTRKEKKGVTLKAPIVRNRRGQTTKRWNL